MSRRVTMILFFLSAWLARVLFSTSVQADGEVQLQPVEFKAVFVSKLGSYIDWPRNKEKSEKFVFGIIGEDPIRSVLSALVEGKTIQGKPVLIKVLADSDDLSPLDISECHILFIPNKSLELWKKIALDADLEGLLTVGESLEDLFLKEFGGVININGQTRELGIDLKQARKGNLRISSKLLRMAQVYR